jgi:hypothetical protein
MLALIVETYTSVELRNYRDDERAFRSALNEVLGGHVTELAGPGWRAYSNERARRYNHKVNPLAAMLTMHPMWGPVVLVGVASDGTLLDAPAGMVAKARAIAAEEMQS